ncbi:MAG: hypothetical protein GSR84_09070 [Desulfurococcales archaeon]|nr:hypothetical protein [Desulfurococcales archaeon]
MEKLGATQVEDLLNGRIDEPARIVADGHTIGYLGEGTPHPRIVEAGDGYKLVLKSLLREETVRASSLREAVRLLIHYNASTKSPGAAGMILSRARALASLTPKLRPETVALAAYTLAVYPAASKGGNLGEIALGASTANSPYASPAASVARILEASKPAAGKRLLELSIELRRRVPVRASRLLAYIAWRLGKEPPYPVLLLIYMILVPHGVSQARGPLYRLPAAAEALDAQGLSSIGVKPLGPEAAMSLSTLAEVLMPSPGREGLEPVVGGRLELTRMASQGSIDPLGGYRVVIAGRYAGVAPGDELEVYHYPGEPRSSFRSLVVYRRLKPCRPAYRRLDQLLSSKKPCRRG